MRTRVIATAVAAVTALCAPLFVATTASATVTPATPAVAVTLPVEIEDMPAYQPQSFCDPVDKAGPVAFGALLTATYPDTAVVDISRPCASDTSEHYDGRALDWGASYKNPQQVAEVNAVFAWLFAPDAAGNTFAMLRRLGIMYVIWNKRIWGTWSQSWQPYSCSGVTACHQDHVHFSFDWAGANKRTSFWTGVVGAPVAVPNYVYTSTRYAQTLSVAAKSAGKTTPFSLKAGLRYRFTVTGTYHPTPTTSADAECSGPAGSWRALAPGDTSGGTGLLDLWVQAHRFWAPSVSTGGGCNATNHTYTRTLTFPTTGPVRLSIDDPSRGDDTGSLKVTVQRV